MLLLISYFCFSYEILGQSTKSSNRNIYIYEGQSVQEAINMASHGDTITLTDGIYHEKITINKSIMLRALNGGEVTLTNKYDGSQNWQETEKGSRTWFMEHVNWPVHWLLVDGTHAFDFRSKEGLDRQECGPYWSKGWQSEKEYYPNPQIYFAWDTITDILWLHLNDERDPNNIKVDFNSTNLDDTTYVQKDLGAYWNQQEIVTICKNPPVYPVTMWYEGTPENPAQPRYIYIPKICGIIINIKADDVTIEGIRIHLAPTVGVETNNSKNVTIQNCYFSGYQYGINTGYECTGLKVMNCEFDGGNLISKENHTDVTLNMWNHSTYIVPVRFNGTGLIFQHNYIYEGFDLFQPRGRHKNYPHVPDLMSDVSYNVWQQAIDNNLEFDGVEALISMRFHHNLVLGRGENDMLAITTTEKGNPLCIDHNLFLNGGTNSRIMKLTGTRRTNDGVKFIHNTYITGSICSFAPFGPNSTFENNIILSDCSQQDCWSVSSLGFFFPTKYNLCKNGDKYITGFEGITKDPMLGQTSSDRFCLQPQSPAIDAGIYQENYHNKDFPGDNPDLGALEVNENIDTWRDIFGHCGPSWISSENASLKAPNRPEWPAEIDKKWGGLD